jgi:site-specific recombinase XerD
VDHNLAHKAISYQNGVIKIDLDVLNCSQVQLIKNRQVQVIQYPSDQDQAAVMLTLAQLKLLRTRFLDHVEIDEDFTESSVAGFRSRTRLFLKWLEANEIAEVAMSHWRDYYSNLKHRAKAGELSPTSVRNYFRDLKRFAAWLVQTGQLPSNPLDGITPPAAAKQSLHSKAIPREDIDIMIDHAETIRDRAIFIFFRDTACRGSEAAAMRWENVDLEQGKAYVVGKGGKVRTLRFKAPTAQVLREYRATLKASQKIGPVWWGKQGALTYNGIYQVFHRTAERAALRNKKFNPHAWRHAFGRDATQAGMPTAILQKVLGHESITTTMIYADPDEEIVHQAHHQYSPVNEIDLNGGS